MVLLLAGHDSDDVDAAAEDVAVPVAVVDAAELDTVTPDSS